MSRDEKKPMLSLIVPAYNEEKRILSRIQSLVRYFDTAVGGYELLVIADGCTDKTPEVVSKYANDNHKVRLLVFSKRLGLLSLSLYINLSKNTCTERGKISYSESDKKLTKEANLLWS